MGSKMKESSPSPVSGMRVAVYAIAKNEGQFVDRWVDSMSEADDIVVVDTGSTDGTVERLKARGVRVEVKTYSPWRFDTPRNDAMALVSCDADILVSTDLDELFRPGWRKRLEEAWLSAELSGSHPNRARYSYIWSFDPDGNPARTFSYDKIHGRFGWRWQCPVHEVLVPDGGVVASYVDAPIVLEHHADKSKSRESYLPLLVLAVQENPEDPRMVHYLAREYMFHGDAANQVLWAQRHLKLHGAWNAERAVSMRIAAKGHSAMGDHVTAESLFRAAMAEDPVQREAAYELAWMLYRDGRFAECADALKAMFSRKRRTAVYVTEPEPWGWVPYDLLGCVLWKIGDVDGSRTVYEVAKRRFPGVARLESNGVLSGLGAREALRDLLT